MSDPSDRRRSERVRLPALAAIETKGFIKNDQAFSAVVDVSRTGILLRTCQPPMVGQQVILRLALGEEIHEIRGQTRRVEAKSYEVYEVGIDWSGAPPEHLAFLERYLTAVKLID